MISVPTRVIVAIFVYKAHIENQSITIYMITLNELSDSINSIDRVLRPVSSILFCILAPRVTKLCDKLLRINEAHISNCNIAGTGPYYSHGLTLIQAWSSSHTQYKVWDEITYPFPNFNEATVWELLCNCIPQTISTNAVVFILNEINDVNWFCLMWLHSKPFAE